MGLYPRSRSAADIAATRARSLQVELVEELDDLLATADFISLHTPLTAETHHLVDLARYLVGEFKEVCAITETFVKQRPLEKNRRAKGKVTVDDAVTMIGRFRNGALASLEATRFAPGRKNSITLEINGSAGSVFFDLEEMNRLKFFDRRDPQVRQGFRDIVVTEPSHPYMKNWWPQGHIIGYEHTFVHTVADFVKAVVDGKSGQPTFEDGLKNQCMLNAVARSARSRSWSTL